MQRRYARWSRLEADRRCLNVGDRLMPCLLGGMENLQFPIGHDSLRRMHLSKPPLHNKALFLNGGSSWVDFGDTTNLLTTTTYTIEFWIFPMWLEKWARIYAQGATANASKQVVVLFYENAIALADGAASPVSVVALSNPVTPGEWQHIAIVRNGSSYYVYRNGESWKGTTPSATVASAGPTGIGAYSTGSGNFGLFGICDFRVWNAARSQANIQANYKIAVDPATSGLVAYWYFDDGGTTIDDKTTGAKDGTITGPARNATTYGYWWYPHA